MAQKRTMNIDCPKCNSKIDFTYFHSCNIALDPVLKENIIDFKLNVAHCENCGQNIFFDDFFIYNDMNSGLFILKYPTSELDNWENIITNHENYMNQLPEKLKSSPKKIRMVFGPFSLKEKILLEQNQVDDEMVEIYKIGLFGQIGKEYFNKSYRLFYYSSEKTYLQFVLVDMKKSKEVNLVKVPTEVFDEFSTVSFPEMKKKELVKHLLESPFVSMEKIYFAKELIKENLN